MTTTRVLVAHDAGARSFENRGPGKGLIALSEIAFEDGRRHSGELDTDRPGRAFDRSGQGRHAYESHEDSRQHAVAHFARALAQDLAREFHQGAFQQLVLVAPPRFLGVLRDALEPKLSRALIGSVPKDLPRASANELCAHVSSFVAT
jgi:protein required for attachment to host cells